MFADAIRETPLPASDALLATGRDAWRAAVSADPALSARAGSLDAHEGTRALLEGIFGSSPFLTRILVQDPAFACDLLEKGPDALFAPLLGHAENAASAAALMKHVRLLKRRAALTIAVADLSGVWTLEQVTAALSDLADQAIEWALCHLLRETADLGRIELVDPDSPTCGSGLFVIGMGKLGARELNYSSDIDLIVIYDNEVVRTTSPERLNQIFVRLTRSLVHLLQERTVDGYVFRTDLRLRPDPASTPLAVSARAAEVYYESMGQNWERAAMIKARVCAGDQLAGEAFLRHLRPFVWRRTLDFEAIRDIHSIKRQINAFRGGAQIAVADHNIKLGRGGIREIEFFAQTQQLIWGGRDPHLRQRGTCAALDALQSAGHVRPEICEEMQEAYGFLRRLEHRLQMVDDQQTHSLPEQAGLGAIARFMGYGDCDRFVEDVRKRLQRVELHYALLFEGETPLGGGSGNLVFTGTEDDPDTIATLSGMGFRDPSQIAALIRGWHHGRVRPTRSVRARELLTELMPALLASFAKMPDPDIALRKFDAFLTALPAGVQLFSLFQSNPSLLDLVAEILGSAPHLAEHLTRHPVVLDAVLQGGFFEHLPGEEALSRELASALEQAAAFEDVLRICRFWVNDRKFQIGVQMLRGGADPLEAGRTLSDVADVAIRAIKPAVEAEFARLHGGFPGQELAVLALGKLGSRELTFASDLDLVLLYDVPQNELSNGHKPLAGGTYFIRLTQRLVTAITSLTGEGKLFEVDLRLRPSGIDGPLAGHIEGFERYYETSAWTWELMALTRARVVTGPLPLRQRIEAICHAALTKRRDPDRLLADVAEMRAKMVRAQGAVSPWAVKHRRGGLVDIEFIAQYLVLRCAAERHEIIAGDAADAFRRLVAAGVLAPAIGAELIEAIELWRRLQMALRLTGSEDLDETAAPEALQQLLARAARCVDFARLKETMLRTAERTFQHFERLIGEPAAQVGAARDGGKT